MERRELLVNLGIAVVGAAAAPLGRANADAPLAPPATDGGAGRSRAKGSRSRSMRVAAVQLAIGADVEANLKTCLRMIDQAAACRPDLIVLPEFCNHWSTVADKREGYAVALEYDGPFLAAIGKRAAAHAAYVALDVTVRKPGGVTTGANVLFDPTGKQVATSDKQVLMGSLELKLMERARELGQLVDTPFGRVGMFSCMDGVLFETPRCVALQGAQLMINTLNSWALDEANLHVPVRAAEFEYKSAHVQAVETPIGRLPAPAALDLSGLNLPAENLGELLGMDSAGWKAEIEDVAASYAKFGSRLPSALADQLKALRQRLG
jgi:predicted amidohydrolase